MLHTKEAHQGVMTDRRHFLKKEATDYLKKIDKRQHLTGKKRKIAICVMGQCQK
jgi:hypothetical protein